MRNRAAPWFKKNGMEKPKEHQHKNEVAGVNTNNTLPDSYRCKYKQ